MDRHVFCLKQALERYDFMQDQIKDVLSSLPPREALVLQLRYGLVDGKSYTLEEVGRKMGVTRERVRQIEAQAMKRLRHPELRMKLIEYADSAFK